MVIVNKLENSDHKKQIVTSNNRRNMEEWKSSSGRFLHNIFTQLKNSQPTKKHPFGRQPNNCI